MAMKKMQKGGKVTKALPKAQKGVSYKTYVTKKAAEPKFTPPNNKPTKDSTQYYADKAAYYSKAGDNLYETQKQKDNTFSKDANKAYNIAIKAQKDKERQARKSKPGFDNDGFPVKYKTGGMVNSNTKVTASKVAKGRPAKSAEPKSASKVATGKVGGVSKAPKAAAPKMKMGGSMKKKSC
jgi:hypothetical protein